MAYSDRSDPMLEHAHAVRKSVMCFRDRSHRLCDGHYYPVPFLTGIKARQPCQCDCEHVGAAPFAELPTIEGRIERLGQLGRIILDAGDARQSISCWIAATSGLTDYHQQCVGTYLPLREPMETCECACGHAREDADAEGNKTLFWISDARTERPVDAGHSVAGSSFHTDQAQQEGA